MRLCPQPIIAIVDDQPRTGVTDVFVLSAVSSLDAGLLAAAVVLLGRPRPAQQLLAYLIGGMGLWIAFGVLIVLGLQGSRLLREPSRSTSAVIEVGRGVLLVIVAIVVRSGRAVQRHPAARVTTRPSRRGGRACKSAQSAMTRYGPHGRLGPSTARPAPTTSPASHCWPSSARPQPQTCSRSWDST